MKNEVVKMLVNGVVAFRYLKNDGTWRNAIGTLNVKEMSKYVPNETLKRLVIASNTNRYFDLEMEQWRRVAYNAPLEIIKESLTEDEKNDFSLVI